MAVESDAEHIPHFTLIPVRRGPEIDDALYSRKVALECNLNSDVGVAFVGEEVIHGGEIAVRLIWTMRAHALVDSREVVQYAVRPLHFRFQVTQDVAHMVPRDPERRDIIMRGLSRDCCRAEPVLQFLDDAGAILHTGQVPSLYYANAGQRGIHSRMNSHRSRR
jgi:hypothetical protein